VLERRGFSRRDWAVEWESSAIEFLLDKGFSPEMGARPLRRAIDQYLLAPLAITLVEHKFPDGDQFLFVRSNGRAIEVEFVDPDAPTVVPESPAAPPDAPAAIAAMILQPTGRDSERAALAQRWHQLQAQLAGAEWQSLKRGLAEETGAPDIWSRSDRQALFARRAQIDRVEEAARTVERLLARLESRRGEAASRELVSRAALQLYLVEQGAMDALASAPVEALLCVEPVFEAGSDEQAQRAWCARLTGMYRHWADRRHMQIAEIAAPAAGGPVILQIAGFGAFRTLDGEAGLHLLEERDGETGRRIAARVRVVPAPATEPKRGEAHGVYLDRLAKSEEGGTVIRRYRDKPAPLVRDARAGWRSGRLDAVLDGDFDLMGGLRETSGAG
jgi:ATP-dependent Clp protease ATP-binding subunit ClpC